MKSSKNKWKTTPAKKNNALPLWVHLIELRTRLIYCLSLFFIFFCIAYFFSEKILALLARPLTTLFGADEGRRFIYTSLSEAFLTYLKASCFAACVASTPFWAFQIWQFTKPALNKEEGRYYRMACTMVPVLFIAGACMAYFAVCPLAWRFFLSFESSSLLQVPLRFEAKMSEYLALMLKLMTVFGLGFQLPVVLGVLVGLNIVSLDTLKQGRKYAFLAITVIAALVTPPDLISPLGLIVPMYSLYEGVIAWLSWAQR
jgi:sec-independent protein translocase protein TatC